MEWRQITVRDGKGAKDRVTMVPETLVEALRGHQATVRQQWEADVAGGYAGVWLPGALARKHPSARPGMALALGVSRQATGAGSPQRRGTTAPRA